MISIQTSLVIDYNLSPLPIHRKHPGPRQTAPKSKPNISGFTNLRSLRFELYMKRVWTSRTPWNYLLHTLSTLETSVSLDHLELQIVHWDTTLSDRWDNADIKAVEALLVKMNEENRLRYTRMNVLTAEPSTVGLPVRPAWVHMQSDALVKQAFPILHSRGLLYH